MARINIQVDLKEKDIIEQQLKEEFKGVARGMAREAMKEEMELEINRLVDAKLAEAKKSDYYNSLAVNITRIVANKISRDIQINTEEVNKLVQEKVEAYINNLMRPYGGPERFIKTYINQSIAEALKK